MKTLKGAVVRSTIEGSSTAIDPHEGAEVKFAATDGGTVIRQWQQEKTGLYITQLFLNGGHTVLESVSTQPLD